MPSSKGVGATSGYKVASVLQEVIGTHCTIADLLIRKEPMAMKSTKLELPFRKQPGAAAIIQFPTLTLNAEYEKVII
jgi:hypothetical protein